MNEYSDSENFSETASESETPSIDEENYEAFLFGKTIKPTYIEREEEIQKEDLPEFNEDSYSNDLARKYERMGEIRSTLEGEVMALISSLILREFVDIPYQILDEHSKAQMVSSTQKPDGNAQLNNARGRGKTVAANVTSMLIKNISRAKGNVPIGRFNSVMTLDAKKTQTSQLVNTTSVSPNALDSLRDLSALLQREKSNVHNECDGIILFQHPCFVTMYILENRIVESHILPLLEVIERSYDDVNQRAIIGETLSVLNFLVTPPAKEWLDYWSDFDRQMRNGHPREVANHPEFLRQLDLVHKYAMGLSHLKRSLNSAFYSSLMHLRLEIQNWHYNGYRTDQRKMEIEQLKAKQEELLQLRDAIINESQSDKIDIDSPGNEKDGGISDGERGKGRLKKSKAKTNHINAELLRIQKELLKDADEVRNAGVRADVQSNLIRNFVYNLAKLNYNISPSEYLCPLVMICDNEHVTLLDIFIQDFLEIFQNPSVQMGLSDYSGARVSYIHPNVRAKLWEFLRLIHVMLMAIPTGDSNTQNLKGDNNAHAHNLNGEGLNHSLNGQSLNHNLKCINLRAARAKMVELRQSNKQTRHSRYWSFKQNVRASPFQPLFSPPNSLVLPNLPKYTSSNLPFGRLLDKIRLFIGIDDDFDLIYYNQQTHENPTDIAKDISDDDRGDGGNDAFCYDLGKFLNVLSYDLLRDAGEEYTQEHDWKILVSTHTWVIEHYTNLFIDTNKKRSEKNLAPHLNEYMLASLKYFIGQHSTLTSKLMPEFFSRLRTNGTLTVKNSGSFYLLLRLITADLQLIKLHSTSNNPNVLKICKEAVGNYLGNKLVKHIFWVLKKWKPVVGVELITVALQALKLLKHVISVLGCVEYSPVANISLAKRIDLDDDFSDNGDFVGLKKVNLDNLYYKDHRQLRCGKIIASLVGLLSYSVNPLTNDLVISYLEEALSHGNHAICWDLSSVQSLHRIISADTIWANSQTRWVGQFAFDILEPFFLKWNSGNLFLPLELWFYKNKRPTGAYSPTSPLHLQSILKSYADETIDFEISRRLDKYKEFDSGGAPGVAGKYVPAAVVNEAINAAIEVFKESGDFVDNFERDDSSKLPVYTQIAVRSVSEYLSLVNLSCCCFGNVNANAVIKLILGANAAYLSDAISSLYTVTCSPSLISALEALHKNVTEAIEIAEIQGNALDNDITSLIEIPELAGGSSNDGKLWDGIIAKLGLKRVTIVNGVVQSDECINSADGIKMYTFSTPNYSVVKDRFNQLAGSTQNFTGNTITLSNSSILEVACEAYDKIGASDFKVLVNKIATAAESVVRYLQLGQQVENVAIPFTIGEISTASAVTPLMDALGVSNFDLKPAAAYQILRLKNILDGSPTQVDEIFSLLIAQYILKFGLTKHFVKCYERIMEWDENDLTISLHAAGSRSNKILELFYYLSILLCACYYGDRMIIPKLSQRWSKRAISFINIMLEDFVEGEILSRIKEWRIQVGNGYDPLTPAGGVGSMWNSYEIGAEEHDSDFELEIGHSSGVSLGRESKRIFSEDDSSPRVKMAGSGNLYSSTAAGDPDVGYNISDTSMDEETISPNHASSPSFSLYDAKSGGLELSQIQYIRSLYQNSVNMARLGKLKPVSKHQILQLFDS